jgi:hypothetical protein
MGNSLVGQVLLRTDYVETKYKTIYEIDYMDLNREMY